MKTGGMLNPNNDNKINEKVMKTGSLLDPSESMRSKLRGGIQADLISDIHDTLHDVSLEELLAR